MNANNAKIENLNDFADYVYNELVLDDCYDRKFEVSRLDVWIVKLDRETKELFNLKNSGVNRVYIYKNRWCDVIFASVIPNIAIEYYDEEKMKREFLLLN